MKNKFLLDISSLSKRKPHGHRRICPGSYLKCKIFGIDVFTGIDRDIIVAHLRFDQIEFSAVVCLIIFDFYRIWLRTFRIEDNLNLVIFERHKF